MLAAIVPAIVSAAGSIIGQQSANQANKQIAQQQQAFAVAGHQKT